MYVCVCVCVSVRRYSQLLGSGLILTQERSLEEACFVPEIASVYGECHPASSMSTDPYGLALCDNYSQFTALLGTNATCACIGGQVADCVPADLADPPYPGMYDELPYNVSDLSHIHI